jgi:hypothetical protein
MGTSFAAWRRALAVVLVTLGFASGAAPAELQLPPYVRSGLVQVDVYDRVERSALPVYHKDGRLYVVGVPGHEYAVRIRNRTAGRILVVTSVDGVNVISGDTAAPSQSGYVLDPWGSVEISGWRKGLDRTAAFYFTDLRDSYAARTGRPQNVGVIGVAVFQEQPRRVGRREQDWRDRLSAAPQPALPSAKNEARAEAPAESAGQAAGAADAGIAEDAARAEFKDQAKAMSRLGTGHGRSEESRASVTRFDRATDTPAEVVSLQYDGRENLIALGVLPQPTPYVARREPNPFPGALRFVPDPDR